MCGELVMINFDILIINNSVIITSCRSKIVKVSYRRKRFIVFVRGGAREVSYCNPQSIVTSDSIKGSSSQLLLYWSVMFLWRRAD